MEPTVSIFRVYPATPIARNYTTYTHFPSRLLFLEGQNPGNWGRTPNRNSLPVYHSTQRDIAFHLCPDLWDLRFCWHWIWRSRFCGMWYRVVWQIDYEGFGRTFCLALSLRMRVIYDMTWYEIWYDVIVIWYIYMMIWYIYDIWYDIWYDIFVDCSEVATRWQ